MTRGWDYIRHWLFDNEFMITIWDTCDHNWQLLWNSQFIKEVSKPEILRLFGISALLGIFIPPLMLITWRIFNRKKEINYTQLDENPTGGFNTKVIIYMHIYNFKFRLLTRSKANSQGKNQK